MTRRSSWPAALMLWALLAPPAAGAEGAQLRLRGERVVVPWRTTRILDGDTVEIRWTPQDAETVRVLGVDTAELFIGPAPRGRPSPRGMEARGFARGAFSVAERIELLRAPKLDPYRRTLGYFLLDGRNYSVLVIQAGLGRETVTRFGDNGFPREARQVLEASGAATGRTAGSRRD